MIQTVQNLDKSDETLNIDNLEKETFLSYKIGDLIYKKAKLINIEKHYEIIGDEEKHFISEKLRAIYSLTFLEDNHLKTYTSMFAPKNEDINCYYYYSTTKEQKIDILFANTDNLIKNVKEQILEDNLEKNKDFIPLILINFMTAILLSLYAITVNSIMFWYLLPVIPLLIPIPIQFFNLGRRNKKRMKEIQIAFNELKLN